METLTTNGIQVSVQTFYQTEYSNPVQGSFFFAYRIQIRNLNPFDVQLLSRHWHIVDSDGMRREVEGPGVVGQQPVMGPMQDFAYVSGCQLHTDIGRMWGTYTFVDLSDNKTFNVAVPEFNMVAPFKLN